MKTIAAKRHYNKWNINELIRLQREYELLEMDVEEISLKHERTVEAILHKLESEGFISSWNDARGYSVKGKKESVIKNSKVVNETSEVDKLNDRIWSLETSVEEINGLVKQMLQSMGSKQKNVYLTK